MDEKELENSKYSISDILVPYEIPDGFKNGLAFIAEAPGEEEENQRKPLVGKSGQLFDAWLAKAKINRKNILVGNVFRYRPDNNKIAHYFISEKYSKEQGIEASDKSKFNSRSLIKYFESELDYLKNSIVKYKPKLIVTLGGISTWSLLDIDIISSVQGRIFKKTIVSKKTGNKYTANILPCYHPASSIYSGGATEQHILQVFKQAKEFMGK